MDNKPNSYSSLYSGEAPSVEQPYVPQISPEQEALINKGRKRAKVMGVIFIVMTVVLTGMVNILLMALLIAGSVAFIKGNNLARILLGIVFSTVTLVTAFILIPALIATFSESTASGLYGIVPTVLILGVCGIFIWFTLLDKSVKAYCKQSK